MSDFNEKRIVSNELKKCMKTSNFTKIRPVAAKLSRMEADMEKLIVAFRNYAKAPKDSMQRHVFGTESVDNLWDYLGKHGC